MQYSCTSQRTSFPLSSSPFGKFHKRVSLVCEINRRYKLFVSSREYRLAGGGTLPTFPAFEDDCSSSEPTRSGKSASEAMNLKMLPSSADSLSDGVATVGVRLFFILDFAQPYPWNDQARPTAYTLKLPGMGYNRPAYQKVFSVCSV